MKTMKLPKYRAPRDDYEPQHRIKGVFATPTQMQPPAKTACAECPLRKDAKPGHLGGWTPEMYVEAMRGVASIACHMRSNLKGPPDAQQHCVGVTAYRCNAGIVPQTIGVRDAMRAVGSDPQFFETPEQFIAHHKGGK